MRLTLKVTSGSNELPVGSDSFVFDQGGGSIGRAINNNCVLPDPERFISSQHALITFDDGAFILTDKSANGVFLNDSMESVGNNSTVVLNDRDILSIGLYELAVSIEGTNENGGLDRSPVSDDLRPLRSSSPPWGAPDTPQSTPGLLDGSEQRVKTGDFAGWDKGADWDKGKESSGSFAPEPATDSDHSPFGQEHYTAPQMKNEDPMAWDRTGFAVPNAPKNESVKTNVDADNEYSQAQDPVDSSANIPGGWKPISATPEPKLEPEQASQLDPEPRSVPDSVFPDETPVEAAVSSGFVAQEPGTQEVTKTTDSETGPPTTPDVAPRPVPPEVDEPKVEGSPEQDPVQVFLRAIGLQETALAPGDIPALMNMLGGAYGEIVRGLMDVLRARSELKNEFRMQHTQISAAENNPLKFSVSVEKALEHLVFHRNEGFLSPELAFQEALQDIKDHQVAMVAGMQAAFDTLLERFDPEHIDSRIRAENRMGHRLPVNRKASCWDQYEVLYEEISEAAEDDFRSLFGNEFTRAYESHVEQLLRLRRQPEGNR